MCLFYIYYIKNLIKNQIITLFLLYLVPVIGLEPTRITPQLLKLICLPFHHTGIRLWIFALLAQ